MEQLLIIVVALVGIATLIAVAAAGIHVRGPFREKYRKKIELYHAHTREVEETTSSLHPIASQLGLVARRISKQVGGDRVYFTGRLQDRRVHMGVGRTGIAEVEETFKWGGSLVLRVDLTSPTPAVTSQHIAAWLREPAIAALKGAIQDAGWSGTANGFAVELTAVSFRAGATAIPQVVQPAIDLARAIDTKIRGYE